MSPITRYEANQQTPGTAGGVEQCLAPLRVGSTPSTMCSVTPEGDRLAGVAQCVQQLLVHATELAAGPALVEVDGLLQLLDDGEHEVAGFYEVVSFDEDGTVHLGDGVAGRKRLETGKDGVVVVDDLACQFLRLALLVGGPVAPPAIAGCRRVEAAALSRAVVGPVVFRLVVDLQKLHPRELAYALGEN